MTKDLEIYIDPDLATCGAWRTINPRRLTDQVHGWYKYWPHNGSLAIHEYNVDEGVLITDVEPENVEATIRRYLTASDEERAELVECPTYSIVRW